MLIPSTCSTSGCCRGEVHLLQKRALQSVVHPASPKPSVWTHFSDMACVTPTSVVGVCMHPIHLLVRCEIPAGVIHARSKGTTLLPVRSCPGWWPGASHRAILRSLSELVSLSGTSPCQLPRHIASIPSARFHSHRSSRERAAVISFSRRSCASWAVPSHTTSAHLPGSASARPTVRTMASKMTADAESAGAGMAVTGKKVSFEGVHVRVCAC